MPLHPQDFNQWVRVHGPYLYHVTANPEASTAIIEHGLIPWNQGPGSNLDCPWTPRPDHVYLGTLQALHVACNSHLDDCQARGLFAVDLRGLDLVCLNPDEDAFWSPTAILQPSLPPRTANSVSRLDELIAISRGPLYDDDMGLDDPYLLVADEMNLESDITEDYPPETVILPLSERPYASYGAWAQANDLGANPAHTLLSLQAAGALAHCGSIDSEHLQQLAPTSDLSLRRFLEEMLQTQALAA